MSLVSAGYLMEKAIEQKYAVPALNCVNLESLEMVVRCAEEERAGIIVQTHFEFLDPITIESFSIATRALAHRASVPIALGLDHGKNLTEAVTAMRNGFTSIMIDASNLPLQENISIVKQVVDLCHPQGITVEAALGTMPLGQRQSDADLAKVEDAVELVRQTGVDTFAPAVGNIHGSAHGEEKAVPVLNTDLIGRLAEATGRPLALHGGSSTPQDQIDAAIANGVRWVVIFSDLQKAFTRGVREYINRDLKMASPVEYLREGAKAFKEAARAKIRMFHANGRY